MIPPPEDPALPESGWLLASAAGCRIAIALELVDRVDSTGPVARVPRAPPVLRGVTQWRGRLLTLLDAGLLFHAAAGTGTQMVVLRNLPVETALAVDDVAGLCDGEPPAGIRLSVAAARELPELQPGRLACLRGAR